MAINGCYSFMLFFAISIFLFVESEIIDCDPKVRKNAYPNQFFYNDKLKYATFRHAGTIPEKWNSIYPPTESNVTLNEYVDLEETISYLGKEGQLLQSRYIFKCDEIKAILKLKSLYGDIPDISFALVHIMKKGWRLWQSCDGKYAWVQKTVEKTCLNVKELEEVTTQMDSYDHELRIAISLYGMHPNDMNPIPEDKRILRYNFN